MRWVATVVGLGLAAAAGCFDPHPPAGQVCAPGDQCPTGLTCDRGICVETPGALDAPPIDACQIGCTGVDAPPPEPDAPVDGSPVTDTDGDTVVDSIDNCDDDQNLDQHDEDGDGDGDVCDNCPHRAGSQANADGDDVGDLCDPSPGSPGDVIARFITFHTGIPGDLALTGTWTPVGTPIDAVETTGTNSRLLIPGTHTVVTAEMGGSVISVQATTRELKIASARIGANLWHSCCFDDSDGTSLFTFEIENENGGGAGTMILNVPEPTRPTRIDPGAFFIRNTADANELTIECSGFEGGSPITTGAAAPTLTAGQVEVLSARLTYTLDYIIVIGHL